MKIIDDIVWNLSETGEWIVVGKVIKRINGNYIKWFK